MARRIGRTPAFGYAAVAVVALVWLSFVAGQLGLFHQGLDALVLDAYDTKIYLQTADWVLGRTSLADAGFGPSVYPVLFPIILGLAWSAHPVAIVGVQAVLWVVCIVLMTRVSHRVSGRQSVGIILGLAFTLLATPAALVFYGLSDVTGAFFAICSLAALQQHAEDHRPRSIFAAVLALCLAALVKSVFMYPALTLALAGLWSQRPRAKGMLLVAAGLLPLVLQSTWFYSTYGLAKPSAADVYTLNEYFLARVVAPREREALLTERRTRHQAYLQALETQSLAAFSKAVRAELGEEWSQRPERVISTFQLNLGENARAGSNFLRPSPVLRRLSTVQNQIATYSLWVSFPLVLLLELLWLRGARRSRPWHRDPEVYFRGYVLVAPVYFLVTTGLAYFQGDRYALLYFPPTFLLFARIYREIAARIK